MTASVQSATIKLRPLFCGAETGLPVERMRVMSETVLLYNLSGTEAGRRLKPVLLKMRIRIRIVEPESYQLPIETLIGGRTATADKGDAGAENTPKAGMSTAIPEPMLVMEGFSERRLDQLLAEMRRHKVPPIALKAIVTAHNREWSSVMLYEELKKEHEAMNGGAE